jgi:RNA polymerase sigma factor (sigma-70 family)
MALRNNTSIWSFMNVLLAPTPPTGEHKVLRPGFGRPLRLLGDEQLASLIAAGERDAFAVAYERHLPALIRYCRGILLVREDAEDAAQCAMVAALRALPKRPPQLKLRAWLFRVAHNEAISLVRRRYPHEPLDSALDVSAPDVAETADVRTRLRQLVSDLRALPDRQRSALVMRELCGLGYDEIAGVLASTESAAMQTVFEARSALVQFEHGRTLSCVNVQRMLSDGDRRSLRARRVRAHMRSCDGCRTFELSVGRRRGEFGLLLPLAGNSSLATLLGMLGWRGGPRLTGLAARIYGTSPGLRGAAVTVVLGAAGVAAHQPVHHPGHAARRASPLHVAARAYGRAVPRPQAASRASLTHHRPNAAQPRRRLPGGVGKLITPVAKRPLPNASVMTVVHAPPPRVVSSAHTPSRPPDAAAPQPAAVVSVGASHSGGLNVTATVGGDQAKATVSATISVASSTPNVAVGVAVAGATRLVAAACLLSCP